jgi:chemotaxis signal transduction protein
MTGDPDESARPSHGGVVFRVAGEPFFLPASIAMKVLPVPQVGRMPGGPPELRGVAHVDGNMIAVVDLLEDPESVRFDRGAQLPERSGAMLVCAVLGESVGLVGIEVVATGRFEPGDQAGEVKFGDEVARTFDVAAVIARVREGRWAV